MYPAILVPIIVDKFAIAIYEVNIVAAALVHEIFINSDEYNNMTLGEGAGMKTFTKPEILNSLKITPYDQFALWMHIDNS